MIFHLGTHLHPLCILILAILLDHDPLFIHMFHLLIFFSRSTSSYPHVGFDLPTWLIYSCTEVGTIGTEFYVGGGPHLILILLFDSFIHY